MTEATEQQNATTDTTQQQIAAPKTETRTCYIVYAADNSVCPGNAKTFWENGDPVRCMNELRMFVRDNADVIAAVTGPHTLSFTQGEGVAQYSTKTADDEKFEASLKVEAEAEIKKMLSQVLGVDPSKIGDLELAQSGSGVTVGRAAININDLLGGDDDAPSAAGPTIH